MTPLIKSEQVSEQGHWYDLQGNPCYTYKNAKGEEKNTTLREARKFNLVPSVTTILSMAAKPALENWKADQVLMSALTCPHVEGESNEAWIARIKEDAKEQARIAREKGTIIHAWVQQGFEEEPLTGEGQRFFASAYDCVTKETGIIFFNCEKSFATPRYGGKCDLHTPDYVIDIKTTDKPLEGLKTWDEHAQQLAAYRHGLGYPAARCGILFINTVSAEAKLLWIAEEELIKGLKCFHALTDYYYAKTGLR